MNSQTRGSASVCGSRDTRSRQKSWKSCVVGCIRFSLLAGVLACLAASLSAQITVTDISPDLPYGTAGGAFGPQGPYSTPAGRIVSLAIDPSNDSVLYAASEWAGVWKSTDAAHSWFQSSSGLRSGISVQGWNGGATIAVDGTRSNRLLYAVQDKDGRAFTSKGGLWISTDGAASWKHVDLPDCPQPAIQNVIFAQGTPYVLAQKPGCRLWTSADPNLMQWTLLPDPPFPGIAFQAYLITAPKSSNTVFGCSGQDPIVYRNVNPAGGGSWQPANVPSGCRGLAGLPPETGSEVADKAAVLVDSGNKKDVVIVDFTNNSFTSLNFASVQQNGGSGTTSVWVAPYGSSGPAGTPALYDVFAADGCSFYYHNGLFNSWTDAGGATVCEHKNGETHDDTWAMAFPSSYNRAGGSCDAYLTDDGGVFANTLSQLPVAGLFECVFNGPATGWVLASSGLHVIWGNTVTGVSHNYFPLVPCPDSSQTTCPTLYLSATDNDAWAITDGGFSGQPWRWAGFGLGDAAEVWVDPLHSNAALGIRNGTYNLMGDKSNPVIEQPPVDLPIIDNFATQFSFQGIATPAETGILQVMSLPSDPPLRAYDYVGIYQTPCGPLGCFSTVVRLLSPFQLPTSIGSWMDLAPQAHFGGSEIGGLAVTGGHNTLTVYVLTSNQPGLTFETGVGPGQVWRGDVSKDGFIHKWTLAMGTPLLGLVRAFNLYVNPYDSNELYATDLSSRTIKVSRNGGNTWVTSSVLTDIASHYGEFQISCGTFAWGQDGYQDKEIFANECSLTSVAFDPANPNIRVATLYPGGVAYSRDAGAHWIALDVTNNLANSPEPIDLPNWAFYDPAPSPTTGYPSIYLALEGHGVERLDGPFPTLGSVIVTCPACSLLSSQGVGLILVVPTLGKRAALQREADGIYRAHFLFDAAEIKSFQYYFLIDGQMSPTFTHTISNAERSSGVISIPLVDTEDD